MQGSPRPMSVSIVRGERSTLFAKFVLYRADPGWIVTDLAFNTNDTAILPVQ